MPLIKHFKATNVWNAFILNSIATSLGVAVALFIRDFYKTGGIKIFDLFTTFSITFISMVIAYVALHVTFGFGGGQLIPSAALV